MQCKGCQKWIIKSKDKLGEYYNSHKEQCQARLMDPLVISIVFPYFPANFSYSYILECAFQGERCGSDVNECSEYAGTDLGCQQGSTLSCQNTHGGFT